MLNNTSDSSTPSLECNLYAECLYSHAVINTLLKTTTASCKIPSELTLRYITKLKSFFNCIYKPIAKKRQDVIMKFPTAITAATNEFYENLIIEKVKNTLTEKYNYYSSEMMGTRSVVCGFECLLFLVVPPNSVDSSVKCLLINLSLSSSTSDNNDNSNNDNSNSNSISASSNDDLEKLVQREFGIVCRNVYMAFQQLYCLHNNNNKDNNNIQNGCNNNKNSEYHKDSENSIKKQIDLILNEYDNYLNNHL